MAVKYVKIFHSKPFQNVPKRGVWFENKPSGNPAWLQSVERLLFQVGCPAGKNPERDTDSIKSICKINQNVLNLRILMYA
jgi:hypothetical protein